MAHADGPCHRRIIQRKCEYSFQQSDKRGSRWPDNASRGNLHPALVQHSSRAFDHSHAYGYGAITNATAGSVSFAVEFGYVDRQLSDDVIEIVTVPSALNAGSDLDLQDQFSEAAPIDEVWVELTNDSDLNYFTFEVGSDQVFEQMPPTTVQIREEQGQMLFSHIGGFYRAPTPRGVVYKTPAGVNTANKLIINLATSRSPTLYLWLSPAPVSVSAASGVVQVAQH